MRGKKYLAKGFTLIELLITVTIIVILTGVAAVSYSGIQARGRDAQRVNDMNQLKIALSSYFTAQNPNQYLASPSKIVINGSTDILSVALSPNFIKTVPLDPVNADNNVYKYQTLTQVTISGVAVYKDFKLFATLENKSNKKGWGGGTAWVVDGYITQND